MSDPSRRRTVEVRPARPDCDRAIVGEGDATLVFAVRGDQGVAALEVSTGWFLPNALRGVGALDVSDFPEAVAGFHSPSRIDGLSSAENCTVLGAPHCWGEGSSIAGRHVFRRLLVEGETAVWDELDNLYEAAFESGTGQAHIEALKAAGRAVRY